MFSFLGMLGLGHFGWFAGELVLVYPHGRASGRLQHEVATSVTSKRMGFVECFPRDLVFLMILEALAVGLSSTRGPRRSCGEIHLEAFRPDGFLGRTRAGGLLPTYELWVTLHGGNGRWQQVGDVTSWLRRSILVVPAWLLGGAIELRRVLLVGFEVRIGGVWLLFSKVPEAHFVTDLNSVHSTASYYGPAVVARPSAVQ